MALGWRILVDATEPLTPGGEARHIRGDVINPPDAFFGTESSDLRTCRANGPSTCTNTAEPVINGHIRSHPLTRDVELPLSFRTMIHGPPPAGQAMLRPGDRWPSSS